MKHIFKMVAAFIVAIMLAPGTLVGTAPANAATDIPFTEVRDGVAIIHTGTTGVIDLNSYLSEGEWACKASPASDNFYTFVDTDLNYVILSAWAQGEYDAWWKSCSDTAPAVKHELSVQAYDVNMMTAKYVSKNVKKKTYTYKITNSNQVVTWPGTSDVALDNNATCMTGSFTKPDPERTFPVVAGGLKQFTSKFSSKKLDYVCFADQDDTVMAYHDSSMPAGMRKSRVTSVTVWGRTFGSARPSMG